MKQTLVQRSAVLAAVLVVIGVISTIVWSSSYRQALGSLAERGTADLALAADRVSAQLQIYRELAVLISDHPVLRGLATPAGRDIAAARLRAYADKTGALDVFYANADGRVLAAAEGVSGTSVAGARYFERAIQGGLGAAPAVLENGVRVYFFAAPDFGPDGNVRGVLVVVADVQYLEQTWPGSLPAVYFTTRAGQVFISNRYELLFWQRSAFGPGIARSADAAPRLEVQNVAGHDIWLPGWSAYLPRRALHLGRDIAAIDMHADILIDVAPARRIATLQALSMAAVCFASAMMLFFAAERRRTLAQANAVLEVRVARRTRDLSTANTQLKREIQERAETEAALRRAEADLVRADKLSALGRMSAGISHELNQPLMAIQQFADNGRAFLDRDRPERAGENLGRISDMATRMGRIIKNLRAFARNEAEPSSRVDLVKVVEDAVELTQARLRECSVRLNWAPQPRGEVFVRGGEVRLTQVLVNLINNAVDAMLDQEAREIHIYIGATEDDVPGRRAVTVADIGPGLKEPEKVFDPFYSTKAVGESQSGDGMGLGLSISYGLVQSFGGNIRGRNGPHGAEFAVELEDWKEEERTA